MKREENLKKTKIGFWGLLMVHKGDTGKIGHNIYFDTKLVYGQDKNIA